MELALAALQESAPTWRRADLIRYLGELLPDDIICATTTQPQRCSKT